MLSALWNCSIWDDIPMTRQETGTVALCYWEYTAPISYNSYHDIQNEQSCSKTALREVELWEVLLQLEKDILDFSFSFTQM